jgi:sugar phosphate isomerase/epimerase
MAELTRLSLNQITTNRLNLREAIEACQRHEIPAIGVWRNKIEEFGLKESAKILRESGLKVSSLCRGGFFSAPAREERQNLIADNLKAIDEATEIGTDVLVLVCGGLNSCSIADARKMIADGIAEIAPYAKQNNIKLGIEPLHPMFAADRSIICSLGEANNLAEKFDETVGVIADVFHLWFDAKIYQEIERAGKNILGFHVSDWQVPLPDILLGRSMMGDGVIELEKLRSAVESAGYYGLIEVEIFNQQIWDTESDEILDLMKTRFLETC